MPATAPLVPPEDFWSRRANAPAWHARFLAWGMPVEVAANHPDLAAAARLSAQRFGQDDDRVEVPPARIQVIVPAEAGDQPAADWPAALRYTGSGDWISLSAGAAGYGVGHLDTRQALVVLAPALAAQPHLVSRYFIDHYVLNFLFRDWGMLHASVVLDPAGETLVALFGEHNSGKSTSALRLLRAGWRFLADGMLLIQPRAGEWAAAGYPVGEVKLRDDMLAAFPEYTGRREQGKTVIDLRAAAPAGVVAATCRPRRLHLCWVERGRGPATRLAPLEPAAARAAVAAHTVYWDEAPRLLGNSRILNQLLGAAGCHRLTLGSELGGLLAALEALR